jgi:hypothetical protein
MSASFHSLLGQIKENLSKTAKPVISNENSIQTSTQSLRKRPRDEKTRSGKSEDPFPYYGPRTAGRYSTKGRAIPDLQDLTVDISFLVIGAQKAGTSWLHTMLSKHPQLRLPDCKELHFWDWNRSKGLRWYSQQFKSSSNLIEDGSVFLGEITPCYAVLKDHHIQEIKTLFPKVKIIFVARDLVDRAWSALCMELRNAIHGVPAGTFSEGDWSMEQKSTTAVQGRTPHKGGEVVNPNDYDDDYFMRRIQHSTHRMRNDYATSIRSWLKVFPREQLLLLNYSNLHEDPKIFLSTVCQHIGVDSQPLLSILSDSDLRMKINSSSRSSTNGNNDSSSSSSNRLYCPRISLLRKLKLNLQPMQDDFNKLLEELGYQWQLGNSTT